ncbi:MAG: hypothetical protein ABFS18_05280 [Thermodesulfobacteriota bacterium]
MNMLSGLYFPGTGPNKELFYSLLCLLAKIDFYQIVADDGSNDGSPYWEGHVVMPLGEDRDRFLAMIRDIKAHAADFYGGYLSALSADSLIDRDESSVWQLVASLHGENREADRDPVLTEKLWQARLILKLAEILTEERADINRGLTDLNRAEQAVFEALKGEHDDQADDDEVLPTAALKIGGGRAGGKIKHLLKAWGALFVMDSTQHSLLVTDSEDAAAILFDAWEELSGERPQLLVELDLPVVESIEAMAAARVESAEAGTAVSNGLQDILAGDGVSGIANLKTAAELWQNKVGAEDRRNCRLDIYLLVGHSLREVWGRISGMAVAADGDGSQPSLVAVLRAAP